MIQYLFDVAMSVAGFIVKVKNKSFIAIAPTIDEFFSNYKSVQLPYITNNNSGMKKFILLPCNTKLHYYFEFNSSYNFTSDIPTEILTTEGCFKLISLDEDVTVDMRE
jgi:hypothetical protein